MITPPVVGDADWMTVTGTLHPDRPGNTGWDDLYLTRQNATAGEVYINEVHLWREGDPAQVNSAARAGCQQPLALRSDELRPLGCVPRDGCKARGVPEAGHR